MGFNTIRKRDKVEPDRWYYHCDRLGVLVWQDVVQHRARRAAAPAGCQAEIQAMIAGLSNHPSIVMWVLFNEDWSADLGAGPWIKQHDQTRLFDGTNRKTATLPTSPAISTARCGGRSAARLSLTAEWVGWTVPIGGHEWKLGVESRSGLFRLLGDGHVLRGRDESAQTDD